MIIIEEQKCGSFLIPIAVMAPGFLLTVLIGSLVKMQPPLLLLFVIFMIGALATIAAAICMSIKRRQRKTMAEELLADGTKTQAEIKVITEEKRLVTGKASGRWLYILYLEYTFLSNGRSITQDLTLTVPYLYHMQSLFKSTGTMSYSRNSTNSLHDSPPPDQDALTKGLVGKGKEVDLWTLWKQLRKCTEGSILPIIYKPDDQSVSYPEIYLQALIKLR